MSRLIDLTELQWYVSGWVPNLWQLGRSMELDEEPDAEIPSIPAQVPGSVQATLRSAGIIPDWNYGFNARLCEWVENRHWMYKVRIPASFDIDEETELYCEGLDYSGWIIWDGEIISKFCGSLHPHSFKLPPCEELKEHELEIVFDTPPRFLGQFGETSRYSIGKPRFYYTWDWMPRIVQTGITGGIEIRRKASADMKILELWTDADLSSLTGVVQIRGSVGNVHPSTKLKLILEDAEQTVFSDSMSVDEFTAGKSFKGFPVELWWPNGHGEQKLYRLSVIFESDGEEKQVRTFTVGFKHIRWQPCQGAPEGADPWICECNGRKIFIQGVNWTPIRPNYADVTADEYRSRIEKYCAIGVNMLRVWGGAMLERDALYELCDEKGIMVWQEFPMCSSGIENLPPDDPETMEEIFKTAEYYLERLSSHVSLTMWCGGNELQRGLDDKGGVGKPCNLDEPLLARLNELVQGRDPQRRFVPASASGPREFADEKDYGKGLHWDVHGPWKTSGALDDEWKAYWDNDDSLFRSEVGSPGASSPELIRKYAGDQAAFPCSSDNPYWRYPLVWWNEHQTFLNEHKREPLDLDEYVTWSQDRQAEMLSYIASACKKRFPSCGGIIIWMGHDSFPCPANTSIIDFNGEYKPAALALKEVFLKEI